MNRAHATPFTLVILTVALVMTANIQSAGAHSFFIYNGQVITWTGGESIRYLSPSTFPPGSDTEALLLYSLNEWSIVPASTFQYYYSTLDQDYPIDNFDGFNDTSAVPADQLDPGVIGVTFLVNNGPVWLDADLVFSDDPAGVGYNFDFYPNCEVTTFPQSGYGYSFLLAAIHELGHAIGLGHDPFGTEPEGSTWFVATMNPRYPSGGTLGQNFIVELHADDKAGARFLYPHSGPSEPDYPELALSEFGPSNVTGQAIPLDIQQNTALPGEDVIIDSVIENLGSTNEFFVNQGFYLSDDDWIDTTDTLLGALTWDIAFEDALQFGVIVTMPDDIAPGEYALGSMIDDLDEVPEVWEDNNAAIYCEAFSIGQLPPSFEPFDVQIVPCGAAFSGPQPVLSHPLNMAPTTWTIDNPEPGMTIDPTTGIVSWDDPVPSTFLYAIRVRATNGAGTLMQTMFIGVELLEPQVLPVPDQVATCFFAFSGVTPQLADPQCMEPILNWSLDQAPPGMMIDHDTGVISWPEPVSSPVPHQVIARATNASGNGTVAWSITVAPGDLSADGHVDYVDLTILQVCHTGPSGTAVANCSCIDVNESGTVDMQDVAWFMNVFSP
ncbi:MAG: hypothetical protein ACYTHJ_10185 [Planctomycetota bacterium]|jgi:hypothetical protein